jgi:hypothetical protein
MNDWVKLGDTVDDGTVYVAVEAPPREGLPPCVTKSVSFDGRFAAFQEPCDICGARDRREWMVSAYPVERMVESLRHRGYWYPGGFEKGMTVDVITDDPAEAEAAWERAEEWVRTGELP